MRFPGAWPSGRIADPGIGQIAPVTRRTALCIVIEFGEAEQRVFGDVEQLCHRVERWLAEVLEYGIDAGQSFVFQSVELARLQRQPRPHVGQRPLPRRHEETAAKKHDGNSQRACGENRGRRVVRQHRLRAGQAHQFAPGDDQAEQILAVGIAESQEDIVVRQWWPRARRFLARRRLQPGEALPCEQARGRPRMRDCPAHVVPALPQCARQRQEGADVAEVGAEFPRVKEFAHVVR